MNKKPKNYTYTIILKPQPNGVFTVNVPALPGCITEGVNMKEALANAKEAIELYVETLIEDKKPIPKDQKPVTKIVRLDFKKILNESEISFVHC